MRINEYKCLEDFINEYNGKFEIGDEYHQGLEFEYNNIHYRICREYLNPLTFYLYKVGPEKTKSHIGDFSYDFPVFKTLFICHSMDELLNCTIIDNIPFRKIIMDDNTLMLSKD